MIYFVGAGPGAPDLLTLRGKALLEKATVLLYTGSLVNPKLLQWVKPTCVVLNTATMTLEEILAKMEEHQQEVVVRLHTGDPCLYGAIGEQMEALKQRGIPYENCPGVSSFCGAASALQAEFTVPGQSQTVIISRVEGRTPMPEKENIAALSSHQATMVLFLSAGHTKEVEQGLLKGGYEPDTPAAIVYKASWPEEQVIRCTISTLSEMAERHGITETALLVIGHCLAPTGARSLLYDPGFTTGYREAKG